MPFSRREFLKNGFVFILGSGFASPILKSLFFPTKKAYAAQKDLGIREAMHYINLDEETIQCKLCPHGCVLQNNQRSFCRARECRDGKLYTLVYELPCAVHIDPIEKKPIFHMLPGSRAFSIATAGCNSRCKFCQNWQISQSRPEETANIKFSCQDVVSNALDSGCRSIAYTYSEPTIFYEYMIDTAKIAKPKGIKNIWHTGGLINEKPLRELVNFIDAANIDLKAFDDEYLKNICAQNLKTITETIKISKECGVWIELTNLVVPTLNDDFNKIEKMALWIKENVGKDVPLHFSRFWPMYKLKNLPPTPVSTLEKARDIARHVGLDYVYIGNVPGHEGNNTYCPSCNRMLIQRRGYTVMVLDIVNSKCKFCGHHIPGIWQ